MVVKVAREAATERYLLTWLIWPKLSDREYKQATDAGSNRNRVFEVLCERTNHKRPSFRTLDGNEARTVSLGWLISG